MHSSRQPAEGLPDLPQGAAALDSLTPLIWWAYRGDRRLAGMSEPPSALPFDYLKRAGLDTVISLIGPQGYDASPLTAESTRLEDLAGSRAPTDAVSEQEILRGIVSRVRSLMRDGDGVVLHCAMGIGRTGTVIGCVLVADGYDPSEIAGWLDGVQRARGAKNGWPESAWQRAALELFVRHDGSGYSC